MICDTMIREPELLEQTIEAARAAVARLSPIEAGILDGIVEGNSSAGIAGKLLLSVEDVNEARDAMMAKLGANATADLVRIGIYAEHGSRD